VGPSNSSIAETEAESVSAAVSFAAKRMTPKEGGGRALCVFETEGVIGEPERGLGKGDGDSR